MFWYSHKRFENKFIKTEWKFYHYFEETPETCLPNIEDMFRWFY